MKIDCQDKVLLLTGCIFFLIESNFTPLLSLDAYPLK